MKVAELQQHLADLARFLDSAGVKKEIVTDLQAIRDGMAPFRNLPLKGFAEFLLRAEAYRSGGEVPTKKAGGKTASAKSATKAPAPDVQALAQAVKQLYDQATAPATTEESIDAVLVRLQPVDKKGLLTVAEGIELKGISAKTKPAILAAIRQRIVDRKGSFQRVGLLDRPAPASVGSFDPSSTSPQEMTTHKQDGEGHIP